MSGIYANPAGARAGNVFFQAERPGFWSGEFISADQVVVDVGPDGAFSVDLVPSEAVGKYRVKIGTLLVVIEVPTRPFADLAELVQVPQGGDQ